MNLCVLVTTMFQNDFSKYRTMNIQSDAVLANQCNKNEIVDEVINGHRVRMISTDSRGSSRNRNIAMEHCFEECDYVLFADDDLIFVDGYVDVIKNEFQMHSEADGIKFNLRIQTTQDRLSMKSIKQWERATRRNMSSSGVWGLVLKKEEIRRANIWFDECFGAGTKNYCGEDTIYIQEMLNKKLHIYRSPIEIASVNQEESTWYEGYTTRYYETVGMVFQRIYPHLALPLAIRSSWKHCKSDNSGLSFGQMLSCYHRGIKRVKQGDY